MTNYKMEVVNDVKPMLRIIDRKNEKQYLLTPYTIIQVAKSLKFIDDNKKKFKVISSDSYGVEFELDTYDDYMEAKKIVDEHNNDTLEYLESCEDAHEMAGNYDYLRIEETTINELKLEERIRTIMKRYVCHKHKECHKPCIFDSNNDQHLCDLSGYRKGEKW